MIAQSSNIVLYSYCNGYPIKVNYKFAVMGFLFVILDFYQDDKYQ